MWLTPFLLLIFHLEGGQLSLSNYFHWRLYPFVTVIMFGTIFVNPFNLFRQNHSNGWLLRVLLQSIIAPFAEVAFCHAFVVDFLASMPKLMSDLEYILCFYGSKEWMDENITGGFLFLKKKISFGVTKLKLTSSISI